MITAKPESKIIGGDIQTCEVGETVTITNTSKWKKASVKLNIEEDLFAHFTGTGNNNEYVGASKTFYQVGEKEFSIIAN